MRVAVGIALVYLATAFRTPRRTSHVSEKSNASDMTLPQIACPVMAAIVTRGLVNLDSQGRATQFDTMQALMKIGNSAPMAQFQALGIASFTDKDVHQVKRIRDGSMDMNSLYLNYNIWNAETDCDENRAFLSDGRPCNANIGFQAHGASTTIRDPTYRPNLFWNRWDEWMEPTGVLVYDSSLHRNGRVMKMRGFAQLLKDIRLNGEQSGEFALNSSNGFSGSNLQYYHPGANTRKEYLACGQWQFIGAWGAFWAAFARVGSNGETFMPEDDLRRFFHQADFPADWRPQPWGWKETFKTVRELQGTGAGEEWVEEIVGVLKAYGEEASELAYTQGMLGAMQTIGARKDDVYKPYPRR